MTRRQIFISATAAAGLALVVLVLYAINRRDQLARAMPAWLNVQQPADGIAAELNTLTADQSWAANRCRPMTASCTGRTAGTRIRRTYPASLEASDDSFIRAHVSVSGGW